MSLRNSWVSPSLSFSLLIALLALLWLGGGASRADVLGQAVVRTGAGAALAMALLFAAPPRFGTVRPVLLLLLATISLVLVQLVPLPYDLWHSLPGRAQFDGAAVLGPVARPLAVVPDATINAAASLLVPLAVLLLLAGTRFEERRFMPACVLVLCSGAALFGLLQFSGSNLLNPLINDSRGYVSGPFANRNHFALFLALGCLIAPVWAAGGSSHASLRSSIAMGLVALFLLLILASGSRAGMVVGLLATAIGALLVAGKLNRAARRAPRWVAPAVVIFTILAIGVLIWVSFQSDRAAAINRAVSLDSGEDMRLQALPVVWEMIGRYFPAGSGFGGFDAVFRLQEPLAMLKPTYFNHAHNDFLEIVLDGGLAGLLLLVAAVGWWGWASFRIWRAASSRSVVQGRLGSAMLLLILLASIVDYPARTPMIMAMIVLAAAWLHWGITGTARSALPRTDQHL